MRRFLPICCMMLYSVFVYSLTIPKGTLYFDNSKTKYSTVSFVYGSDTQQETYVLAMTLDGNKWRVSIPEQVNNMYRFTFVGGDVSTGTQNMYFSDYKEYVSKTLNLNRTATSAAQMNAGEIFVPESGDNWAQGAWTTLALWQASQGSGSATISGTLPVVYINTNGGAAIDSKDTYVAGSLYIDPLSTGSTALGTQTTPVSAQFKGRGNWTWSAFDKKPYKIKFDAKQSVLGMPNNKHWCLMAYADDYLGYLKNPVGHMLSEVLDLKWTPHIKPVELVINGQYQGLYFLTEHIRIAGKRINITEQEDNATDSVSGGWLVEIDNYREKNNIEFYEGNGQFVMVTIKEPEVLSNAQHSYVQSQMNALNSAIYGSSADKLWGLLDLNEAAKYYLVQEIMEDCESYHGSCYLYKDRDRNGQKAKWCFGPVWDFGNAYNRHHYWGTENWIYVAPQFQQYWIGKIATWPEFQNKVQEYWYVFYHSQQDIIREQIASFVSSVAQAAKNDAAVWNGTNNYCENSNMMQKQNDFLTEFNWRINWLYSKWGEGKQPTHDITPSTADQNQSTKILRNGQIFIMRNGCTYTLTGARVE